MASMVMVNNQTAGSYDQLRHSSWHGWTFTDMVFPFFLWIVGVAMTLSTARRLERGEKKPDLIRHAFIRFALIFAVGLFMNGFPNFDLGTYRILGVLQRIAICYLIATLIYLYTDVRGRVIAAVGCIAIYTALMHPGGYGQGTNLSNWIDGVVLGPHNYANSKTWDPEGFLSTLPSISTCLLGVLTGDLLRASMSMAEKAAWMLFSGNVLFFAAQIFNVFQPINKPIWTGSYAVLMAGLALMVFGSCYWLIDVRGHRNGWTRPFIIFGMNAMAVYVFHELVSILFSSWHVSADVTARKALIAFFAGMADQAGAVLLYSLVHVATSFVFAYALYRRQWFLRF